VPLAKTNWSLAQIFYHRHTYLPITTWHARDVRCDVTCKRPVERKQVRGYAGSLSLIAAQDLPQDSGASEGSTEHTIEPQLMRVLLLHRRPANRFAPEVVADRLPTYAFLRRPSLRVMDLFHYVPHIPAHVLVHWAFNVKVRSRLFFRRRRPLLRNNLATAPAPLQILSHLAAWCRERRSQG